MTFLKQRLAAGDTLRGALSLIPSATVPEAFAAAGLDFVIIDREHGPVGRETLHAMIAATAGTGCAPLVRVPGIEESEVKLALDCGAEGVVFPLVRSAEDARRCVELVRYPPAGVRGFGPFVAHSRHGTSLTGYADAVGGQVACVLLIETVEALRDIDAILATDGVDLAVVALFDLSSALGVLGRFDDPAFVDAVAAIERAAAAAGVPLGGAALTAEQTAALLGRGYRFLIHGFDLVMLRAQAQEFGTWG